jgi:K+-sensing histidine kinase KdpD
LLLNQIDGNWDHFNSAPVSLHAALSRAIQKATEFAGSRRVTLGPPPACQGFVSGDEDLLVRAVHSLLETAVKFSGEGEAIGLSCEAECDLVKVIVESRGKTIPAAALSKFFELFLIGEASTPAGDLGLGPAVASRILSLFGASVSVANRNPSGIQLTVTLKGVAERFCQPEN